MLMLPPFTMINGFRYRLVLRTGKLALYAQELAVNVTRYEVFRIRLLPSAIIRGNVLEEREAFPCDQHFGVFAWSCLDMDSAIRKFISLVTQPAPGYDLEKGLLKYQQTKGKAVTIINNKTALHYD
jgi:hypothetical protein